MEAVKELTDSEAVGELLEASAAYWADYNEIVLANGDIFSFDDRKYQIDVMNSTAREICVMKATGLGFSEIFILRTLHGCRYGRFKQGVLYLFPNADEMRKYSQSRFGPVVKVNRLSIGRYVKSGGRGTDTANLKRIGTSTLYMDGATLTQVIGGGVHQKESAALRGKQVDCVVFDELDLMDEGVIAKAEGRMGNSDIKESVYISNPTVPGIGIDRIFQTSTQHQWFRKCGCGGWTCSDEHFPDLIGIDNNRKGFCACSKCGKSLGFDGEWVAKCPDKEIEGYHISHLNSVKTDPYTMKAEYEELIGVGGQRLTDFYKFRLGLPHVDSEDELRLQQVLDLCGNDGMLTSHKGPCAMGVDVGKIKHVVIGTRTGKDRFEIVKVAQLSNWNDIHDLAKEFHVKSAVIDLLPGEDSKRFQEQEPYRIFLCQYTENPINIEPVFDTVKFIVKVYRTGIFDTTAWLVRDGRLFLPRDCPQIREFAVQLCNAVKVMEINKRTNTSVYRYIRRGDDHYRSALNYFYLAASGSRIAKVGSARTRQLTAINEYSRI